jgi:hypothetical protein
MIKSATAEREKVMAEAKAEGRRTALTKHEGGPPRVIGSALDKYSTSALGHEVEGNGGET